MPEIATPEAGTADLNTSRAENRRVTRALTEFMSVDPDVYADPAVFEVKSGSGETYVVNVRTAECNCKDNKKGFNCKHYFNAIISQDVDPLNPNDEEAKCPDCIAMKKVTGTLGCFKHFEL